MKKALPIIMLLMCSAPAFAMDDMKMSDQGKMMMEKHMEMADTNHDGMISMSENEAMSKNMFMKMDTNGDKMISKEEMMAMPMKDSDMSKDGMMKKEDKMMMNK